jgi:ABC-type glycerol-3-phosphate transport system substrate-binding protein
MWRGVNAASVMLPLTPQVFKRTELEKLTYSNLLNTVHGKTDEVYLVPALVGMDGCNLLYNAGLLRTANVDPKSFTDIAAVEAAAAKLVVREGDSFARAGLLYASIYNNVINWILDQGGSVYEERNRKWTWQTDLAERAFQTLLDDYYTRKLGWLDAPAGIGDAMGNGHLALWSSGAFTLFKYTTQFQDTGVEDVPMPGYVAGKPVHYFQRGIAGYSLSPLLKGNDVKTQIGAAFLRHLLSPDGALGIADNYSGVILIKSAYDDPRFKQTRFGPVRANYPQQVIGKMVILGHGADDADFAEVMTKGLRRQLSVKELFQQLQQTATQREAEAQRNLGG